MSASDGVGLIECIRKHSIFNFLEVFVQNLFFPLIYGRILRLSSKINLATGFLCENALPINFSALIHMRLFMLSTFLQ